MGKGTFCLIFFASLRKISLFVFYVNIILEIESIDNSWSHLEFGQFGRDAVKAKVNRNYFIDQF